MRTLIDYFPFESQAKGWLGAPPWPAHWIRHPKALGTEPFVGAYRLQISVTKPKNVRIHVSADERYTLYLDGIQIGRGPERGDHANWFFETYELSLEVGEHTLVAHAWWLGDEAPIAQFTYRPGFLLAAEGEPPEAFNTGCAPWDSIRIAEYTFTKCGAAFGTGSKIDVDGRLLTWGVERGQGGDWTPAITVLPARNQRHNNDSLRFWQLTPATLPAMLEQPVQVGTVRHIELLPPLPAGEVDTSELIVESSKCCPSLLEPWQRFINGQASICIPPRTTLRVIVDLDNYYCAYPQLVLSGGSESAVKLEWAESLYCPGTRDKGNRNEINGKCYSSGGVGDLFRHDGKVQRRYSTLWWQAGRYIQLIVSTGAEPLTIESFVLHETHYPLAVEGEFEADDARVEAIIPLAVRVTEMCSHETFMDCPYYEQLMYAGDSRLEALTTYAMTRDDRLPRKAIRMFDSSRASDGLTASCYPCRTKQIIPSFSLWWIAMLHDYAFWRNDLAFVRSMMPGVRSILDAFLARLNSGNLIEKMNDWNFMDWVQAWPYGVPPHAETGVSGVLNWHFIYVLTLAADLESIVGYPELAARNNRLADEMAHSATNVFFDEKRGLLADDQDHAFWSEHSQCLAILSGRLPACIQSRVENQLAVAEDIQRTTISFTHVLFECYSLMKRPDLIFNRLGLWLDLHQKGFKTTIESPEPSRSDCHGWGAHPLFHFHSSILGIRPMSPAFRQVEISPQLGPLRYARSVFPHPDGPLLVDTERDGAGYHGSITLPRGITGVLRLDGRTQELSGGNYSW